MIFFSRAKKRFALYREKKREEEEYLKKYGNLKTSLEKQEKDLISIRDKVAEETARLRLTEQRITEQQAQAEIRLKAMELGGSTERIFADALNRAVAICWDLNKEVMQTIAEKIRMQATEEESQKYERTREAFLKKFEYTGNIMESLSILKVYHSLKEMELIAERQEDRIMLDKIHNQLEVLSTLGIVK